MKYIFLLSLIVLGLICYSQEKSKVLLLTKNNSKIYYWTKAEKKKQSGIIKSINDEQIIVDDTVSLKISELKKFKFNKARYFVVGKKVDYLLHTDDKRVKGKLNAITDSSLIINEQEIALKSISQFGGRATSLTVVKVVGGVIMIAGGGLTYAGLSLISSSANSNDCGAPINMLVGIGFSAVGVAGIIAGGVPLFFRNKHYDLGFEWTPVVLKQKPN
ncbi:MAG: hypothetical protein A2033_16255 [Bacteroidetes bacterium GWA2_31_9]|nr:MAG: hypothetical protein A2033_16255 [Bacteroidetes bacterium GWA2_31_9]